MRLLPLLPAAACTATSAAFTSAVTLLLSTRGLASTWAAAEAAWEGEGPRCCSAAALPATALHGRPLAHGQANPLLARPAPCAGHAMRPLNLDDPTTAAAAAAAMAAAADAARPSSASGRSSDDAGTSGSGRGQG